MEKIDLPNGMSIKMKEIVRKFAYESKKNVKCIKIDPKNFLIDTHDVDKNFLILTIIPDKEINSFIEEKLNEEERRKQYKIEKEKKHKKFIEDIRKELENGEEFSLIWFSDNIAYDIWGKDNGVYKVHKKDTEGEFDDNRYETWTIDEIILELESRDTPEEIIKN